MIDGITDCIRLLNVALVLAVLASLGIQWRTWRDASSGGRLLRLALAMLVAAIGWSATETLLSPITAPGIRTYVVTVALAWCLAGLWLDRDRDGILSKHRPAKRG